MRAAASRNVIDDFAHRRRHVWTLSGTVGDISNEVLKERPPGQFRVHYWIVRRREPSRGQGREILHICCDELRMHLELRQRLAVGEDDRVLAAQRRIVAPDGD